MIRDAQDEHEHDPNDHADAHAVTYDVDEANGVRYAVCRACHRVVCVCDIADEEAPGWLRNYTPAAPRVVRDDQL